MLFVKTEFLHKFKLEAIVTGLGLFFVRGRYPDRLYIYHADARSFVRNSKNTYDAIFLDAFNSMTPPPHLTTLEFMRDLWSHLTDKGFLMINVISAIQKPAG